MTADATWPRDRPHDQAGSRSGAPAGRSGARGAFRLALPLYLALLLLSAYLGVINQGLRARQVALVDDKAGLEASVAYAEVRAAAVEGPMAVAAWAESAGMVPLPAGRVVAVAAPEAAPVHTVAEPHLELKTVWR